MQVRPLHQALLRPAPFPLYAHALQVKPKPRMTVTTCRAANGDLVWYLGGELAETGVERSAAEQAHAARDELAACLPWVDLGGAKIASFKINRAEGLLSGGGRPEGPVLRRFGRVLALWPTKLAMAPSAAEEVLEEIRSMGVNPTRIQLPAGDESSAPIFATALCDSPSLRWMS
jgi:hypothetical protein